jgi:hypothetical protein
MTKDQVITVRLIDNGWVASFHTAAPYAGGEFYAETPQMALSKAFEALALLPKAPFVNG